MPPRPRRSILNAFLPREKAAPESTPQPAPSPQPLVEELVLDETHGLIAPITELPQNPVILSDTAAPTNNEACTTNNEARTANNAPLQNCHPERSSASAPNAVEEPVLSLSKEPAVASPTAATLQSCHPERSSASAPNAVEGP